MFLNSKFLFFTSIFFLFFQLESCHKVNHLSKDKYPVHHNITVTYFWIGESGNADNKDIPNRQSVWDDKWQEHYGGIDSPENRNGFLPVNFIPNENPFYCALPYNDRKSKSGKRKKNAYKDIYWAEEKQWSDNESMCKNKWIKITKGNKTIYAQWEDAGPFGENDWKYVFGTKQPKNKINNHAGIDVSPAIRDYLELDDIDKVDWQFVSKEDVPDGVWRNTITRSNIYWQ